MPDIDANVLLGWPALVVYASLFLSISVAVGLYRRQQRRVAWAQVLQGAQRWVASVGGELMRVSEQPPLISGMDHVTALRYRVNFIDGVGAECVATLQRRNADEKWSLETIVRAAPTEAAEGNVPANPPPPEEADLAAESYARRHRGRESDVPVIFATRRRRRRRRS